MVFPIIPALLEFRGPDAVRFLNGQLTQDVRLVIGKKISLSSCVTDAKGKLQFRVTITENEDGALWIAGPSGSQEALEARLTRYLIADDVEVIDLSGKYILTHLIGSAHSPPVGSMARESNRYGEYGIDCWTLATSDVSFPAVSFLSKDELESLRIKNAVPAWGSELIEGMLPPEARLESTDISYNKGCYIGQEIISRMKSSGKVNRRLNLFSFDALASIHNGPLIDTKGTACGELTSISPMIDNGVRYALGYVKRGVDDVFYKTDDGLVKPTVIVGSIDGKPDQ